MKKYFSLSKKELLLLAAYSIIFPITNLIGGILMLIGIFIMPSIYGARIDWWPFICKNSR